DDLEGRDVDEDPVRPRRGDALREIVLERHRQPVVHVHLDADQQAVAHLEDRDAFHATVQRVIGPTASPALRSAMERASASLGLVMTSVSSTPRCTMVCAICGRMPLTMHSAPMRRAAATVFSRCWATSVSTVGTPVMSTIAMVAPLSTIFWSRFS